VDKALAANPELERARALREQARYRLNYEEAGRLPSVAVRAARETDREMRQFRIGLNLTIPLWDRRQGPVREAEAEVARAASDLDAQSFAIRQDLEVAYRQYEVTQAQVSALENGLVAQARAAVTIAETAYRAGERGLIDVLDAQRVLRSAQADLINSRFELASAWVEIQRLVAPVLQPVPPQETP
jgi:cobalt-zinc-cadmium efflux system outer membrane protein